MPGLSCRPILTFALLLVLGAGALAAGLDGSGAWQPPALGQTLPGETLPAEARFSSLLALADDHARAGRSLPALVLLDQGLSLAPAAQRDRIWERSRLLLQNMNEPELAEAAFVLHASPLRTAVVLQQAKGAVARGDTALAQGWLETLLQSPGPSPGRGEAAAFWEKLTGRPWQQRTIGVVLPLSGRYAAFGELIRRGIELAIQSQEKTAAPVRFLFCDNGADPKQTPALVARLIREDGVMAILGPLTGAAAMAAAEQAQAAAVPMIALSPREGLPEIGNFIFRNSLTPALEIRTLVGYATAEAGLRRFAVLYPESRQGRETTELFAAEVKRRGGIVAARQGYDETATDFRRQIRLLQNLDPTLPEASKTEAAAPPVSPPLTFDALFIPDVADKIALIAPQLAYYGLEGVTLLGGSGWNSPDLLRQAGPYVEGAILIDGFFRHTPFPFVQEFADKIFARYGEEPSILEAQGYDTADILLSLLARPEVNSREALRRALASLRDYPGLTGATSFTPSGEADKILYILQVQNGDFVQIN